MNIIVNNTEKYLYLLFLILCWTMTPFCKKKAIGQLSNEEYFVVNFIITALLAALFWIYLVKSGQTSSNVFSKMSKYELVWATGAAILSIIGAICLIFLIKNYEVSHIMPQLTPSVLILTTILGFLFFKEKLSFLKVVGIITIIIGFYLITYS